MSLSHLFSRPSDSLLLKKFQPGAFDEGEEFVKSRPKLDVRFVKPGLVSGSKAVTSHTPLHQDVRPKTLKLCRDMLISLSVKVVRMIEKKRSPWRL